MHSPIFIKNLSFFSSSKLCFENFSVAVHPGSKLALIGNNGSGKSSLIKIILKKLQPSSGSIDYPSDLVFSFVEQTIVEHSSLSGAERFNKSLTEALQKEPDVLILDEPTNHLDTSNRKSVMRLLQKFRGTVIFATHDEDLIRTCSNQIWEIRNQQIKVFFGSYDDFVEKKRNTRASLLQRKDFLHKEQKSSHKKLMKEQVRASKSKTLGKKNIKNKKWATVVSNAKALRAQETTGKKQSHNFAKREKINSELCSLKEANTILPTFYIQGNTGSNNLASVRCGSVGHDKLTLVSHIELDIQKGDKISLVGENGCGKSTFIKALLGNIKLQTKGVWNTTSKEEVGYLDQHYHNLDHNKTVIENLEILAPNLNRSILRKHLADFLFFSSGQVQQEVNTLSGGEKARLSLCIIAANTPKLLILDEITNNLDLETKHHIVQVLNRFPGAMLVVSHDKEFLKKLDITMHYTIHDKRLISI